MPIPESTSMRSTECRCLSPRRSPPPLPRGALRSIDTPAARGKGPAGEAGNEAIDSVVDGRAGIPAEEPEANVAPTAGAASEVVAAVSAAGAGNRIGDHRSDDLRFGVGRWVFGVCFQNRWSRRKKTPNVERPISKAERRWSGDRTGCHAEVAAGANARQALKIAQRLAKRSSRVLARSSFCGERV